VALFANHSGFAADGTVTNEKDARDFLKKANELQKTRSKKLKEAGKQLIEFGKEFRKLAREKVKVAEKGQLEINGEATTTLLPIKENKNMKWIYILILLIVASASGCVDKNRAETLDRPLPRHRFHLVKQQLLRQFHPH